MGEIIEIPLVPVASSNLLAIGFDGLRGRVAVQFKSGQIYYYAGVPFETMEAWAQAESQGRFYATRIRGQFPGELMTGPCNACGAGLGFAGDVCRACGSGNYVPPVRTSEGVRDGGK